MQIIEKTVGQIAAELPAAVPVFEKHHIDYCCGGNHPIGEACRLAGERTESVLAEVAMASIPVQPDWNRAPLQRLIEHLGAHHYGWLNCELPLIAETIENLGQVNAGRECRLAKPLQRLFQRLVNNLDEHIRGEDKVVFPAIVELGKGASRGVVPKLSFGSLHHPVSMLERDHHRDFEILDEIRDLTYGYTLSEDDPPALKNLYRQLQAFETEFHAHIHLENNILFPRAVGLESL